MNLSDTDQAPYSAPAPQTATVSDEAVQVALEEFNKSADYWPSFVDMRKALTAALPYIALSAAPCSVEIRGLIWKNLDNGGSKCETDSKYSIDFWPREKMYVDAYTKMMRRKSLSEAKEAMQGQFERFFKPYIVTKPVDVAAVRRQAFEEAKQAIADLPTGEDESEENGHENAYRAVEALSGIDTSCKFAVENKELERLLNDLGKCADLYFSDTPDSHIIMDYITLGMLRSAKKMHSGMEPNTIIRALSPAEPVDQWQDIATAPKDVEVLVGAFVSGEFITHVYRIIDKYWREQWDEYEPTHWMPLPAAPASKGGV